MWSCKNSKEFLPRQCLNIIVEGLFWCCCILNRFFCCENVFPCCRGVIGLQLNSTMDPGEVMTDACYPLFPSGLYQSIKKYSALRIPIYITETGAADRDAEDYRRKRMIRGYTDQVYVQEIKSMIHGSILAHQHVLQNMGCCAFSLTCPPHPPPNQSRSESTRI